MIWKGETPIFLIIAPDAADGSIIDVDEPGWLTTYASLLREPGAWYLLRKSDQAVALQILVNSGEQPYYTARHVGIASAVTGGRKAEITAYGIGKKRLDGHVDRLWYLPDGSVCAGDDVEAIALRTIKRGAF